MKKIYIIFPISVLIIVSLIIGISLETESEEIPYKKYNILPNPDWDENLLRWKPTLSWSDFRTGMDTRESRIFAQTSMTFVPKYRTEVLLFEEKCTFQLFDTSIIAAMEKDKSFKKPGVEVKGSAHHSSEYILAHEKGHFDNGFITAKRLEKKFSEMGGIDFSCPPIILNSEKLEDQIVMDAIAKWVFEKLNPLQMELFWDGIYELETDYSYNVEIQEKWNQKIQQEFKLLTD